MAGVLLWPILKSGSRSWPAGMTMIGKEMKTYTHAFTTVQSFPFPSFRGCLLSRGKSQAGTPIQRKLCARANSDYPRLLRSTPTPTTSKAYLCSSRWFEMTWKHFSMLLPWCNLFTSIHLEKHLLSVGNNSTRFMCLQRYRVNKQWNPVDLRPKDMIEETIEYNVRTNVLRVSMQCVPVVLP